MAEVLVTGANGFIGSHLVEELLARGHDVSAVVRKTSDLSALANLPTEHRERLRIVIGDVRRPADFAGALSRAEYVYHLAAVLLGSTRTEFFETNVEGTRRLLEQLERDHNAQLKRVLITSSQAAAGPSPTSVPIDEKSPTAPVSWYGESKAEVETIANAAAARGLPVSIVRPVAVYGEREMDLARGMFPVVSMGLRPRVGLKPKTLTLVYVKDLLRGMIAVAESDASLGQTYFLANSAPNLDSDVSNAVAAALGKRRLFPIVTPMLVLRIVALISEWMRLFSRQRPLTTRDKLREVRFQHWAASPAAAKHDVNWQAEVSLKDGIKSSVEEWRSRAQSIRRLDRIPDRDRKIMTYTLAILFGVLVESTAWIGKWYTFSPPWLIFVIVFAVFGGIIGTLTYVAVRWKPIAQFIAGALVGTGFELANGLWLHLWEFSDTIMRLLPNLYMRSIVLGLPAGLLPIVLTALLRKFNEQRQRIG
jgi:nucleoside-diphosphate-sugar epimerase